MAIGSGVGSQIGFKQEGTPGTYSAPDHFYRGMGSIQPTRTVVDLTGVAAGQLAPTDEVVTITGGTMSYEGQVRTKGEGLLFQNLFGPTVTPVQQAATTAYLQTHSAGDNRGRSLTGQISIVNAAGTAQAITLTGGKVLSAEFSCGIGEVLTAKYEIDGRAVVDSESLASASYTSSTVFPFSQAALKLGTYNSEAAVQGVRKVTWKITRPQNVDEAYYMGNSGVKVESVTNDHLMIDGSIEIDYVTKTDFFDRILDHTSTAMMWEFVGANIASTYYETFRLRAPKVYFGTEIPGVTDMGVPKATVPFRAFLDTTNGLTALEYMSTDTTV